MKRHILAAALMTLALGVQAQVKLSPLFTDNMVLQQQTDAPIWGTSKAGKKISLKTSWDDRTYTATADQQGRWRIVVATPSAGGPYSITISDGRRLTLSNVMIGEVWICSGQSNMDMPISGWGKVRDYENEISNAKHPRIRLLQVPHTIWRTPQSDIAATCAGWQECSPEVIGAFSSTAYFFGRELEKHRDVPVGLIQTSWGGSPVEAWTSNEGLAGIPTMPEKVQRLSAYPADKAAIDRIYAQEKAHWDSCEIARDKAYDNGRPIYGNASLDETGWDSVTIPAYVKGDRYDTFDGIFWLRRVVDIPKALAGKPLTLCLGHIDDDDITYFNGVEVGRTEGCTINREYNVPAELVKEGRAVILVRNFDTGGDAGIPGYKDRPCQLLSSDGTAVSLNGTWKVALGDNLNDIPARPRNANTDFHNVSVLYNAMISPLVSFAIRGAIWYQGEENANRAWQYRDLLPALINDWRAKWGKPFPFYIVQLANYMQSPDEPQESAWAELREAQTLTANSMEACAQACIIDIGEAKDIHPKNKQEVGRRLALLARALTYGEQVAASGPTYSHHEQMGEAIRVYFDNCGAGLRTLDGKPIKGFAVAGADHKYHWAEARQDGNTVVLTSKEVSRPLWVRYAWADNPQCNLTNDSLLPALPFRTDDWPGVTFGNTNY